MAYDPLGRKIDYLRVSLTDRCNFRCIYCMPAEGVCKKSHESMLSLEEIERIIAIATEFGIKRIRLTGGEPLVRKNVEDLIAHVEALPDIEAVALTTNGSLLAGKIDRLKDAGLSRVNISLDSLDPEVFTEVTRTGKLEDTLAGIDAALEAGLNPVKVNCVVVRSLNQDVTAFARLSYDRPIHVRFIEYMPVGDTGDTGTGWTTDDIIPTDELIEIIDAGLQAAGLPRMQPIDRDREPATWGPAHYRRIPGAQGTVGFITPMSNHFCGDCNRLRLTADGKLRPCLFSDREFDLMGAVRTGDDDGIRAIIADAIEAKPADHYDIVGTRRNMSQIGG